MPGTGVQAVHRDGTSSGHARRIFAISSLDSTAITTTYHSDIFRHPFGSSQVSRDVYEEKSTLPIMAQTCEFVKMLPDHSSPREKCKAAKGLGHPICVLPLALQRYLTDITVEPMPLISIAAVAN
jgi:hypothetical protein